MIWNKLKTHLQYNYGQHCWILRWICCFNEWKQTWTLKRRNWNKLRMTSVLGSLHPTGDAADFLVQPWMTYWQQYWTLTLTSFHEQCVYTEPFCCCPLLEAQMETRTGPRRHRIVYTYKKAEYLIGVLPTCTRPFIRYCCCLFSPVETKMRYGTDCIRPKSPVYTSETERYGSNKKRYLTVWIYIVVSHAAVFGSSRNAPPQEMAAYIRTVGEERCVTWQKRLRRRQV